MKPLELEKLIQLQNSRYQIRNICILAHVDHGKTTLADSLVASNGIISHRMAGKLRYMDSRPDEQERGITMKSSSIALFYKGHSIDNEFIINLIDSPGHVDFSSEVSTAVRLCDGAIILVDVVEGVCPQTRICLKQAYTENLKPILVLNKIDRLIMEKKMTPLDAYVHMAQVLEQVNAVMGNLFASDVMSKEENTEGNDYTSALENSDDSNLYFAPENGNVIFCSALDGWAFIIRDFAFIYEQKLGILWHQLEKVLWGDYYYSTKERRYIKGAQEKAKKPMFVQFILENIWNVYETLAIRKDKEKFPIIAEKLGIKLTPRDLRHSDHKVQLQTLFAQWLPIDKTVLEMVVKILPHPGLISEEKAERLMCSLNQNFLSFPEETQNLKKEFINCDPNSDNVIIFISKMFPIQRFLLPENRAKPLTNEEMAQRRILARQRHNEKLEKESTNVKIDQVQDDICQGMTVMTVDEIKIAKEQENAVDECEDVFIAFARIYSGTLKKGSKLYVLGPKHDPRSLNFENPLESLYISEVTVNNLYLLMGKELESLDKAAAGNVIGIGGLENHVLKTATLSTSLYCPSFTELSIMATPILRVAVEPQNTLDMPKLVKGLKLLNQADACVQVIIQETGEHVLLTLGEVHLERCILDLEQNYSKIKLNVSKPIVPFRETIVPKSKIDMVNEVIVEKNELEDKSIIIHTSNKQCSIKILAVPLSKEIVDLLEANSDILKNLLSITKAKPLPERSIKKLMELKAELSNLFKSYDTSLIFNEDTIEKIWSLGPRKCGTNILLNLSDYKHSSFWSASIEPQSIINDDLREKFDTSFKNGFQLATQAGPLCEEPLQGVCFIIKDWIIDSTEINIIQSYGPFSGQIMSAVKEGCRKALQNQHQRLVTPMYSCTVVVNAEALGKMYAVIARRNGKILSGDLTQGSGTFSVTAYLPVIESFNFAQEIRKQTSGLACPQLVFSHWEIIDTDPFWVPYTEEEYLHFGEKADSLNRAKVYMDSVRKRKGLHVEEKIVEHAEKQRTLSKKK